MAVVELYADSRRNLGMFDHYLRECTLVGLRVENMMLTAAAQGYKVGTKSHVRSLKSHP